ncbi:MAG: hypothetical protein WKF55_13840 [Gemmatimonadaceae bacterium]
MKNQQENSKMGNTRRWFGVVAAASAFAAVGATPASAQWSTTYEQFYLPGSFNWAFREGYPAADRLFNAFDYGHAILYEKLYTKPTAPASLLENKEYDFITGKLLINPPHVPLEEAAIEVAYAKLAPEAKMMFDWAHLLHRQIYDVWADERMALPQKDAKIAELIRYYKKRPELAFSSVPKTMELMEGQYYSTAFRDKYPKFNGLIWAYHWLQVGLYEPLVTGKTQAERQTGVLAAVARFRQMLESPPSGMPRIMPMTAAVAPAFAARYPEASIIFDNLHSMHDVVSDVLASPKVPMNRKRTEILKAAALYRDNTSFAMTRAEWLEMTNMMGVNNMGGAAVNFLAELPTPTVARGAVHMAGMNHGATGGMAAGGKMAGMDHSKMAMPAAGGKTQGAKADGMAGMDHSKTNMAGMDHSAMPANGSGDPMMKLHMEMLADPVIMKRVMADPGMRRMMNDAMKAMPAEHQMMMRKSKPAAASSRSSTLRKPSAVRKPATAKAAAGRPAAKPVAKPAAKKTAAKKPAPKKDPMAGMDHSKMKM